MFLTERILLMVGLWDHSNRPFWVGLGLVIMGMILHLTAILQCFYA